MVQRDSGRLASPKLYDIIWLYYIGHIIWVIYPRLRVNSIRLDLMGGEKRCNLRKEEMIAANIADMMVIYLFTILLITLLSPVGIIDRFAQ